MTKHEEKYVYRVIDGYFEICKKTFWMANRYLDDVTDVALIRELRKIGFSPVRTNTFEYCGIGDATAILQENGMIPM